MRFRRGILAGAAAALGMALGMAGASAQCHLGAQMGATFASTTISAGPFSVDGAGSHSTRPDVGAALGCDLKIAGGPVVVGGFVDYMNSEVKFSVNPSLFSATLDNSVTAGGRIGVLVGEALPYLLVGYTHTTASWSVSGAGLPSSFDGVTFGGGIEIPLKAIPNVSLAAEGRWTRYNAETIGKSTVELQPDAYSGMVRLNWTWYAPAAPAGHASVK